MTRDPIETGLVKRLEDSLREIETISDRCVNVGHYTASDALDDLSEIRSVIKRTDIQLAALSKADMGWQDIETAPKDGTLILAFDPDDVPQQVVVKWHADGHWEGWLYADDVLCDVMPEGAAPTHWMPLLASPVPSKQKGKADE
jgi:hypothetical protein